VAGVDAAGGTTGAQGRLHHVFISYASQDKAIADAVAAAMEGQDIKCWIAPRDITPGAHYASEIVHAIDSATAIVLVLSKDAASSPHVLREIERATSQRHPVITLRLDKAPLPPEFEYFLNASQWLDASGLDASQMMPKLVSAARLALNPRGAIKGAAIASRAPAPPVSAWWPNRRMIAVGFVIALGIAGFVVDRFWVSTRQVVPTAAQPGNVATQPKGAEAPFSPPAHSIAVLPFVNMSGDPNQDYFSDGIAEELLDSLSRLEELQVAARTSSFSFRGQNADIATIARKLNVGAVLEGSVRRGGNKVRVTVQLINAISGFHLWSQTYDRDLGDVLKLQTEVATSVASALKVSFLKDVGENIGLGGTRSPAAFDAYLRGKKIQRTAFTPGAAQDAISAYTEAIQLDPHFALVFAERSVEYTNYARFDAHGPAARDANDRALADARTALALAPALADAHYALGAALQYTLEFATANQEFRRAMELAPGSARMLVGFSRIEAEMGHAVEAVSAGRRAIALDPLNFQVYRSAGIALSLARQYPEAVAAFKASISLEPGFVHNHSLLGEVYYAMGNFEAARSECAVEAEDMCLANTYRRLGRHADAEAALHRIESSPDDESAYAYACFYAQWGDKAKALDWLEKAMRLRDPDLTYLKAEADLDPLRDEPRFQAIERELKFPP
jgi:TolB-like protein/tetratricopeptide (TPR) repeat protein